jgi:hypothetical protein
MEGRDEEAVVMILRVRCGTCAITAGRSKLEGRDLSQPIQNRQALMRALEILDEQAASLAARPRDRNLTMPRLTDLMEAQNDSGATLAVTVALQSPP